MKNKLSEEEILFYVENKLPKEESDRVTNILRNDPELYGKVKLLKEMVAEQPKLQPPQYLEKSVMTMLGISPNNLFEIILKKTEGFLEIIKGKDFFRPNLSLIPIPVRSKDESMKVFSVTCSDYPILLEIMQTDKISLRIKINEMDQSQSIRFKILMQGKKELNLLPDKSCVTKPVQIENGNTLISVEENSTILGQIHITVN